MDRLETTASSSPVVRVWSPPAAFDEYQLVHLLGRGAMGQVYLARDTLLDRLVAVKFIGVRVLDEDERRERFRVEARAIARLHHPNVVIVHRVGEVESQPYLVSEYVRGERLDKLHKPVPSPRLLVIAIDLARGLAAAHRHGVLHRDIKPANVMVADGVTKLLDFGLAKLVEASTAAEAHHREPTASDARVAGAADEDSLVNESTPEPPSWPTTGAIVGTPLYMAPEIWRKEPATRRSDVYSLGVLLYELGAGRLPHAGKSLQDLCIAVTTAPLPPLGELAENIDAGFAAVVDRCVATDPRRRFESGDAVREALEALVAPARADRMTLTAPYRGLRPFEAEHRALFFGRDREVRAVIDRLRTDGFVLVAGDSGVGKSSLVAAGVLPALAEGALSPSAPFTAVRLVPGRRPLAALAAALAPVCGLDEVELGRRLAAYPMDLARLIRRRGAPVVVVIDQLEELVTLADAGEASATAEVLCELAGCGARDIRLIGTVRADFLARVAALSHLREELPRALYLLPPLSPTGLREAIIGPVRALGWSFESESTVDALVDTATGPGALPLLEFALAELWEARDPQHSVIPAAALEAIGGVAGALVRHADAVIARLLPADRALALQVLSLLVTAEGTRVRRSDKELVGVSPASGPERTRAVVEALVRGRVLVARPAEQGEEETTYELAHEILVSVWGTLRSWLNNQAEALAARARVERAAAEWQRSGRPREALWYRRQLAEANLADPASLGPREREFLQRSRAAARLRRVGSILAILALPLIAGGAYGGNQWVAHRARDREIAQRVSEADAILERARKRDLTLEESRRSSFAEFDAGETDDGEREWEHVVSAADELEAEYDQAQQTLEGALLLDGSRVDVQRRFAEVIYDAARAAERSQRLPRRDELLRRLRVYDADGALKKRWETPAHLDITATPDGTRISIQPYENVDDRRRLSAVIATGAGTLRDVSVAPGSYLVTLNPASRAVVRYPVFLERGEHREVAIAVPSVIPEGFVYVAAGRFLGGSADQEMVRRNLLPSPPLHTLTTGAYFIQRTEVTMRQWLEFLRTLPPGERNRRRPQVRSLSGNLEVTQLDDGRLQFVLQTRRTSPADAYRAVEGELIHYRERTRHVVQDWLNFPVTGISWNDAIAYAAWLAASGRVPGARLCNEREWERAARGADGRIYPHGDRLEPDDANFDKTYGQKTLAFGADTVGLHPQSDSPFGVADLAGNVWEFMRSIADPDLPWYGGGCFYQDRLSARSNNRVRGDVETRSVLIGLRLCADAPE